MENCGITHFNDKKRADVFKARTIEIDAIVSEKSDPVLTEAWQTLRERAISEKKSYLGPWQQTFRACFAQRGTLKKVFILPSHESKDQWMDAQTFINGLLPDIVVEPVLTKDGKLFQIRNAAPDSPQSRDYEEYEYVSGGIERAIEMAKEQFPGIGNDEIGIDITPGQKPFSVAAAVKTLNEDYNLLYVTNVGEIKLYRAWVQLGKSDAVKGLLGS